MLDRFILNIEEKHNYILLVFISFIIAVILSYINSFVGGNSLFALVFITLALAYPLTSYMRELDRLEIEKYVESKNFIYRYSRELLAFWSIFIGVFLGLLVSIPITDDFTYQKIFVDDLSGNMTQFDKSFTEILFNNLKLSFFTLIISFFVFSGLIFILVWNASILAYYISTLGGFNKALIVSFLLLPHGLLEIGGYIFSGFAGALLAFRLDLAYTSKFYKYFPGKGERLILRDRRGTFDKILNKRLFFDFTYLVLFAVILVFLGAIVEVL